MRLKVKQYLPWADNCWSWLMCVFMVYYMICYSISSCFFYFFFMMNGKKRLPTTTSCFTELNRYMVMKWMALPLLCLTMDISRTSVVRSPTQSHTYFYRFVFWNDSSDYKALQYCKLVNDPHAYCSWHGASWLVGTWWMSNGWRHHVGMGKAEMMQNTWHTCLSYCLMGTSQAFFQGSLFEPPAHIAPHNFKLLHHSPVIITFAII